VPTPVASGLVLPLPELWTGSSWKMLVTVIVTSPGAGLTMPEIWMGTNS